MHRITSALHAISDSGNELLSKTIVYAGIGGSSVGIANNLVVQSHADDYAFWGMVAGVAGGLSLVIKSLAGVYFDYQKNKRDRLEFESKQNRAKKEYQEES